MKERLMKQVVMVLLFAVAMLLADHSHIDVLQRGSEAIRMQMAAEYTWDEVKKAGDKTVKTVSSLPGRINGAVQTVTGKPVLGEPIDEKRHGKQSSVYAVDSGQVVATGEDETIGKYVRISHGKEGESLYGNLEKILVKVPVKVKKETVMFTKDEGPRAGVTAEGIAKLKPAFKPDGGTVTAANASGINDGAAAIVVMSEEKAKELGVKPMATWVGGALGGVDPSIMGVGPVAAVNKLMKKLDMKVADMDLIEANEAFAAQSLAVGHDLEFDPAKLNVNGGAIALGHPVGASGCRILVTLLHEMQRRDAKTGLATLCIGGGMGCATVVKRD